MKKQAVFAALMTLSGLIQAETILSDDFSAYSHQSALKNKNWKQPLDKFGHSKHFMVTGHKDGYIVFNGESKSMYHAVNQNGFSVGFGETVVISSDVRFVFMGGQEQVKQYKNWSCFGLLIRPDCKIRGGDNYYFSLVNRFGILGNKIKNVPYDEVPISLSEIGLNADYPGISKWLHAEWTIADNNGTLECQGRVYVDNKLIHASQLIDSGIQTGTKLWTGYSSTWNSDNLPMSEISRFSEVHMDNFKIEVTSKPVNLG